MKIKMFSTVVLKGKKGFTLIEALVTLSILLISITGTLSLFTIGLKNLAVPKHMTASTNIARTKIEEIKNTDFEYITSSFPEGDYPIDSPLLPGGSILNISYPGGISANPLSISVAVSWVENEEFKTIQLATLVTPQ